MNEPRGPNRPQDIESRSFEIIESEVPEPRPFAGSEWLVVRRLIHTSADFEMLRLVQFHPGAVRAGIAALAGGALVVTDTEMARMGISSDRMDRLGCRVVCAIRDPDVAEAARKRGTTRAEAAVDHGRRHADDQPPRDPVAGRERAVDVIQGQVGGVIARRALSLGIE